MKHLNKLASVFCVAAMGLTALTGCEGSDMFSVKSPDWLSEKVDSIANSNQGAAPIISPTILGAEDNSDEWWTSHLDQDIHIESNKVYSTTFTNYSSQLNNWNNYVIVLRKSDKKEYAVLRSDDYGWGDAVGGNGTPNITHSNTGSADWAAWLSEMNGAKVTVTVSNYGDNTCDVVANVVGTNGTTSTQKYLGIPVDAENLYLDFTTDGCHYVFDKPEMDVVDAKDQQPSEMKLIGVPDEVDKGSELKDLTSTIKAQVTYADGAVKEVDASDLSFIVVPAIGKDEDGKFNVVGERYVVATYGKTLLGKTADNTISASAKFNVVAGIKSIKVTKAPTNLNYYYYTTEAFDGVEHTLPFNPAGMEVTATYVEGEPAVLDNSKLTFSAIPAKAGKQEVTITTENGRKATVEVNVEESKLVNVAGAPATVGAEDNTSAFWSAFSNDVKVAAGKTNVYNFTNYTSGANYYNNFDIILRKADLAEYGVLRADNWGWGASVGDGAALIQHNGNHVGDLDGWLAAMNGAKCTVYVTNNGNNSADVQIIMHGTDGKTYTQYYAGIVIDPSDFNVAFTVDGSHMKFNSASSARKHYTRSARRR